MRCTQTACLVSLGLAGSALIVKTVLVSMSGKHKRSPKSGDSPTAKEPKVDRSADVSECKDVQPTAKEIAAAEAARARLNGDTTAVAPVSLGRHCTRTTFASLPGRADYCSCTQAVEGKLPDGQEPAAVDVDYTATGDLQPLDSTTLEDQLQVKKQIHLVHTESGLADLSADL